MKCERRAEERLRGQGRHITDNTLASWACLLATAEKEPRNLA